MYTSRKASQNRAGNQRKTQELVPFPSIKKNGNQAYRAGLAQNFEKKYEVLSTENIAWSNVLTLSKKMNCATLYKEIEPQNICLQKSAYTTTTGRLIT